MQGVSGFAVSVASLVGREHVRLHRNNQDAAAVRTGAGVIAAVVADGCSAGAHSEVGASIGADFLARWLVDEMQRDGDVEAQPLANAAADALCAHLRALLPARETPADVADYVHRNLLFTLLCAAITPARVRVFGIGDGTVSINGAPRVLSSGPDNAPDYLGYRLVSPEQLGGAARRTAPLVHHDAPTSEVRTLMIASDGFPFDAGLDVDLRFAANPTLLQRRLVVLGEREKRMFDDATAVLLQRQAEA